MPDGVAGRSPGRPSMRRPRFTGCRPSASFGRVDALQEGKRVATPGERHLEEHGVHFRIGIEPVDEIHQVGSRGARREGVVERPHPHPGGGAMLRPHVHLRGGVLPHQHRGQAHPLAPGGQGGHPGGDLGLDGGGRLLAGEEAGAHRPHRARSTSRIIEITVATAPVLYPSGITMSA